MDHHFNLRPPPPLHPGWSGSSEAHSSPWCWPPHAASHGGCSSSDTSWSDTSGICTTTDENSASGSGCVHTTTLHYFKTQQHPSKRVPYQNISVRINTAQNTSHGHSCTSKGINRKLAVQGVLGVGNCWCQCHWWSLQTTKGPASSRRDLDCGQGYCIAQWVEQAHQVGLGWNPASVGPLLHETRHCNHPVYKPLTWLDDWVDLYGWFEWV